MIEEIGTVVELKGKHIAVILCQKSSACKHCAAMSFCQVGDDNKSMLVEAHNALGAVVGDRVKLATSSSAFLRSSFFLYVVPLIGLVLGAIIGQLVGERLEGVDPDLLSAVIGVAFLVGTFLLIRVGSRALPKENYMPNIAEILPGGELPVKE